MLGGGRGGLGDVLVQLLAVALMLAQIASRRSATSIPPALLIAIALVLALPLLQLLPLPASCVINSRWICTRRRPRSMPM